MLLLEATLFLVGRPLGQTWAVLILLPLEGGLKYLMRGTLAVGCLVAVAELARELHLGTTVAGYDTSWSGVMPRITLVLLVASFDGALQSALERESRRFAGATATYERLRDSFLFEPRGEIDVKGKGRMATYLLVGRPSDIDVRS